MFKLFQRKDPVFTEETRAAALVDLFADMTEGALKVYLEESVLAWEGIRSFGSDEQQHQAFMVAESFQMGFTRTFAAYSRAGTMVVDLEQSEEFSLFAWAVLRARYRRNGCRETFLDSLSSAAQTPGDIQDANKLGMDEGTKFAGFMTTGNDDLVDIGALRQALISAFDLEARMAKPRRRLGQQTA